MMSQTSNGIGQNFGVKINQINEVIELSEYISQCSDDLVIVDALFGTGVQLPLSSFLYEIINFINQLTGPVISVDLPSGVHGDTGMIMGNAINATATLAVGLPKLGHYVADGALSWWVEFISLCWLSFSSPE